MQLIKNKILLVSNVSPDRWEVSGMFYLGRRQYFRIRVELKKNDTFVRTRNNKLHWAGNKAYLSEYTYLSCHNRPVHKQSMRSRSNEYIFSRFLVRLNYRLVMENFLIKTVRLIKPDW